jgi:pimeloyl-ACP methyl ester carboxylesterase
VHGNPGSSEDFDQPVAAVGAFGRALAFDLPGWGRAKKPRDFDYSIPGSPATWDAHWKSSA